MNRIEHLLTILAEECTEVGQRASKAIRFSPEEVQPSQDLTNAQRIVYEFNDIIAIMEMLKEEGVINLIEDRTMIDKKKEKVEKFLLYSKECGTLK